MNCETVRELLEAYTEGEMDEPKRQEVESHIVGCESCKQELALTQCIPRLVRSLPAPTVPGDIIPNVLKQTHQILNVRRRWIKSLRWQIATALILLIAISLFSISYQNIYKPKPIEKEVASAVGETKTAPKVVETVSKITRVNVPAKRRSEPTEEEIASAVEGIELALGVVKGATESIQTVTLREGAKLLDVTKSESAATIKTLSEAQLEVVGKLRSNLVAFNNVIKPFVDFQPLKEGKP